MKKVGVLQVIEEMDIMEKDGYEYEVVKKSGERFEFPFEERIMYLCKPWCEVGTYTDELGVHYICAVYDGVHIDIWGETIDKLLKLLSRMLSPSEESEDFFIETMSKKRSSSEATAE